tara:strand:- start:372 stop:551 length:180 start_codon:yes stop_codon:yes gene_type:complete
MLGCPATLGVFKKIPHSVLSLRVWLRGGTRSITPYSGYDINVFDAKKDDSNNLGALSVE